MASVKVKFRPSSVEDRAGTIYYQIIQNRVVRQIPTGYHLFAAEWNPVHARIVYAAGSDRAAFLNSVRDMVCRDVERLTRLAAVIDRRNPAYTADDVVEAFQRYSREGSLFYFMEALIRKFRRNSRIRTAETYASTLNSFRKFRQNEDIMLDALTSEVLEEYQAHLQRRGVTLNTISFYMRILRAVYRRAVDSELIERHNPFRRVYTGVDKTVKRALPLRLVRKIKALDLSHVPALDYARDMFIMSFYLRGMSFVDMAFLRKADLRNGYIFYRRRKTGQQLVIAWTKEMQKLLDKYSENPNDYLLPIIRKAGVNERSTYRNASYNINRSLKVIADKVGITMPLTLYVARHSWASAAKAKGIPVSVISEGMGHDSETTTRIYLASLDTSVVDKANALIIRSI